VREDDRRARIMAAVTGPDPTAGAGELAQRLCRFAVDEMALSGCAIVLMSEAESASVLAGAGQHARTVTGLGYGRQRSFIAERGPGLGQRPYFPDNFNRAIGSLLRAANARNDVDVKIVNRQWNEIRENLQRRAVHNKVALTQVSSLSERAA